MAEAMDLLSGKESIAREKYFPKWTKSRFNVAS